MCGFTSWQGSVVRACGLAVLSGHLKPCPLKNQWLEWLEDAFPLEIVPKIRILGDTS